jgi:hypothetical protein
LSETPLLGLGLIGCGAIVANMHLTDPFYGPVEGYD